MKNIRKIAYVKYAYLYYIYFDAKQIIILKIKELKREIKSRKIISITFTNIKYKVIQ